MAKINFFYLILLLSIATPARADYAETHLPEAEKQFQAGEFEKAALSYKKALEGGETHEPGFFYNYGTALAKSGAVGQAYVALMRAAFGNPFDSDTRFNLLQVEQRLPAAIRSVQPVNWFEWWPRSLRIYPWQLWLIAALLISSVAFVLARRPDRSNAFVAMGLSGAFFFLGGLVWMQQRDSVVGVITAVKLKSGPGTTFSDIVTLEPGSLANRETIRDGWFKIRFVRGESGGELVGWIEPTAVIEIK